MSHRRLVPIFLARPFVTASWAKFNALYVREHYREFVEWFAGDRHHRVPRDEGL